MSYIIGSKKSGGTAQIVGGGTVIPKFRQAVINGNIAFFGRPLPQNYAVLYNGQTLTKEDFTPYSSDEIQFAHNLKPTDIIYFVEWVFIPTII